MPSRKRGGTQAHIPPDGLFQQLQGHALGERVGVELRSVRVVTAVERELPQLSHIEPAHLPGLLKGLQVWGGGERRDGIQPVADRPGGVPPEPEQALGTADEVEPLGGHLDQPALHGGDVPGVYVVQPGDQPGTPGGAQAHCVPSSPVGTGAALSSRSVSAASRRQARRRRSSSW